MHASLHLRALALSLPLAISSCDRPTHASADPAWIRLEGTRMEVEQKISVAQIKLARLDRLRESDDTVAAETLAGLRARSQDLAVRRQNLESQIADVESAIADARHRHLETARASAVGLQYPQLETRTGNHYEQVKILAVNDSGVKISHSAGISHLGSEDLDAAMAEQVGLDKNLELAANQRLNQQQLAFEQQMQRELSPAPAPLAPPRPHAMALYHASVQGEQSSPSGLAQPAYPVSSYGTSSYYYRSSPTTRYYYVWNTGSYSNDNCRTSSSVSSFSYPRISPAPGSTRVPTAPKTRTPYTTTTP